MKLETLITSKPEMENFINDSIGTILSGDVDPLEVEIKLRFLEKAISSIRKDVRVKNYVWEEASKYNGQKFRGCDIKLSERKTADYSLDNEWLTLKSKLKGREALLKASGGIDVETGEQVVTYKVSEVLNIKL